MMSAVSFFAPSVIVCSLLVTVSGVSVTWSEVKTEFESLNTAYSIGKGDELYTTTIPRTDGTTPLEVTIGLDMYSMGGYDAVNGAMEIMGAVSMTWVDSTATLAEVDFTNSVQSLMIDYRKIWTPVIVLTNSAVSIERVGDKTYKARFNLATNVVTWKPRVIMTASCTPDVSYFPFDQQQCTFVFTPWFHDSSMIKLVVNSNEWGMDSYESNGLWSIESTMSETSLVGGYYYATFTVVFNRKSAYFTLNVVLPILLLSVLSGFVFLLPPTSGERVGFGITCFLSFVVLLQTMMQFLPEASNPMSLLCYYVIIMMMFSAVLSIVTILLLKVYNVPEGSTVPRWLVHIMEILKCVKCKRACRKNTSTTKVTPAMSDGPRKKEKDVEIASINSSNGMDYDHENKEDDIDDTVEVVIDWDSVGWLLDLFFLTLFIGAQAAFSMFFLVPLATKY